MAKARVMEAVLWVVLGSTWGACAGPSDDAEAIDQPLAAAPDAAVNGLNVILVAPVRPVSTTDEQRHLLYELVVENTTSGAVTIVSVEAATAGSRPRVTRYQGDALAALFLSTDPQAAPGAIPAGGLGVLFLDAAQPRSGDLPQAIRHALTVDVGGRRRILRGPVVPVVPILDDEPIVIAPPLRGPDFLDLNGCCDGLHRRALLQVDGRLRLAQRFAIDFVQVDLAAAQAGGDPFTHGDSTRNESYLIFGAPIHAVAAGEIVDLRDGVPENDLTQPLPPADIQSAPGNYVVERLGARRYALYAHLQTGTVRVHVGDRVSGGQVLGQVGNTGNSTMPHLHFHVMDAPSPLGADGLPYTFARFELPGTTDLSAENPTFQPTAGPTERRRRLPMGGDILTFRDEGG